MSLKDTIAQKGSLSKYNSEENLSNSIQWLPLDRLTVIDNQPFKTYTQTKRYSSLLESVVKNGILNPIIVRLTENGEYQILSGRHRYLVAQELRLVKVPCIIKTNLTDDEANLILIDSNLCQREELLPSEKAFSYKQKMDILSRRGVRTDLIEDANKGVKTSEMVGKEHNISSTEVVRYVRLTYLITPLLDKVDDKVFSLSVGYALSFLPESNQQTINSLMDITKGLKISSKVATKLKELYKSTNEVLSEETIKEVLFGENLSQKKVSNKSFYRESFGSYFNEDTTEDEIVQTIQKALELYFSQS